MSKTNRNDKRQSPSALRSGLRLAAALALSVATEPALANENVVGRPKPGVAISSADASGALAPDRMLARRSDLSERIRAVLNLSLAAIGPAAAGSANHPFTTQRAVAAPDLLTPVDQYPWRATGKLFMKSDAGTFVCTASVIAKNLLVTAAHCVHDFGKKDDGFVGSISFEPARHANDRPFGTWKAREWWIPASYHAGTDKCTVAGVVCENDLSVVVLEKLSGKFVSERTGMYGFPKNGEQEFGYFPFLGQNAAQITQLGYPAKDFSGVRMLRTDSLGYKDDPNNVIIGSNQTGGSSGGPWLQNFGTAATDFAGDPPADATPNQVVATTSWGYIDGTVKIQGASRFAKNTTYTLKSNIESLVDSACGANPDAC